MIYRALGLMSGSSLDGLDLVFAEFHVNAGHWSWDIRAAATVPYAEDWADRLRGAAELSARDYLVLHAAYGRYLGEAVNHFIEEKGLQFQVGLVASHGHTTVHSPQGGVSAQLGDGATLAAVTGLAVVSDLRSLDVAHGGQGAPIVPLGESLLFTDYRLFLNLGGIANLSVHDGPPVAFDICPANRVLNALAQKAGKEFDEGGRLAAMGTVNAPLLSQLNALDYYQQPSPKSLANEFGTGVVLPLIEAAGLSHEDALATYTEHVAVQIHESLEDHLPAHLQNRKLLVTGGGGFNTFLVSRLREWVEDNQVELVVADDNLVHYKEALVMAALGVLRWREENTTLASVTGARRDSIGGALWLGQEA
ncbi:anhydro-N-acetylmuramic acid kinase [Flaviaesturariibacter aridisoli]|uniref:Anhydro-N-acetylmuramic acid kinase n=1 Tax=Flaviaesturariibacter aridisoli TaxID=2545761 RepID=A0A4R4EA24_9BACT|nr:anhydro-N-acetylmuramic acid kinase [Flaviaesturariibacter aridisoli]TCZ74961.1 anhydro-N-acetylmuramic acid kinase [Flaviaesturariibacter aridisoli]